MKWIWITLGTLTALVAIMAAVGAMLPRMHSASRSTRLRHTPEEVWAVLTGPPDWRSNIKSYGSLPNGRFWEEDTSGERIEYEVVEERAPLRRVTRIATAGLPYGGSWTYELEPADGGTRLRIREDGEVYNVFFRFISRYIIGQTSSIEGYLRELGAKVGERVEVEP